MEQATASRQRMKKYVQYLLDWGQVFISLFVGFSKVINIYAEYKTSIVFKSRSGIISVHNYEAHKRELHIDDKLFQLMTCFSSVIFGVLELKRYISSVYCWTRNTFFISLLLD